MLGDIKDFNDSTFTGCIKGFDDITYTFSYNEFSNIEGIKNGAIVEFDYDFSNGQDAPIAKNIKIFNRF